MKPGSTQVDEIRSAWRQGRSQELKRRRKIGTLAAAGLVDFAIISLYQLGVVRHLPDVRHRLFDSDRVNASRKAFATGIPDGTTGTLLYASILVLSAAYGTSQTGRHPLWSLLLGGAVSAGAIGAAQYLFDMAKQQERACPYCITGALLNFSMVPLAFREAQESLRQLSEAHHAA